MIKKPWLLVLVLLSVQVLAQNNDELIKASLAGDVDKVKSLVEAGANVNYTDANGNTPVGVAYLSPEVTQYLISKGADVNGGFPSLVSASRYYSIDVMKMLLKAGADPNKPGVIKVDMAGPVRKLLEDEKAKGKKANKTIVKIYEEQLAKMPAGNTLTFSALQWAVGMTNCKECIQLLLDAGAKTDFKSSITGGNIIHELAFNWVPISQRANSIAANIPYLEKAGMGIPNWYRNINIYDKGNFDDILKLLKAHGADMEFKDNNQRTPLKNAVLQPKVNAEVVLALIDNGADIKATGMTNEITEFQKETADAEKIKVRFDFPREGRNANGAGYSANMDLVNPKPKRIALISFYLYDPGKGKVTGNANSASVSASVWRTPDAVAQTQIDGFYGKGIGALKASFKENGMDLLTPSEFLDTDEKAEFYYDFSQETAKKEKTSITRARQAGGFMGETAIASVSTLKISPSDGGYRQFFIANEAEDESTLSNFQGGVFSANRKLTSSLGYELCKGLGVDAVVAVYICTRKPKMNKDDYGVNAVVTMMFGPNPGRSEGTDPEAKNLGQFYCGTRTYYSSPAIFKEADGIFGQYDGIANVLKMHVAKMARYVNGKEKDED
ncbi:MAG TPA: ankyrin repeat domain-containing protein [Cyclobacteriaceae bacterium]|nr:ankyrin repeat domain-containing protein [Cyclobacteriaceae bacterium]